MTERARNYWQQTVARDQILTLDIGLLIYSAGKLESSLNSLCPIR
jgi:hypothetical protein